MGCVESFLASSYRVYSLIIILFLVGWYLLRIRDNKAIELLEIFNLVFVSVSLLKMMSFVNDLIISYFDSSSYVGYAFTNRISGPYWWAYWSFYFSSTMVPQIFWWRKIRRSSLWSLIVVVLINSGEVVEWLIIFIASLRRDYVPSSWQLKGRFYESMDFYALVFFLAVVSIAYRFIKRNNKGEQ